jgi:hypothetical protein
MKGLSLRSILFSVFVLLCGSAAHAATPLLAYNFGNQVASSTLAISSDGTVVRLETLQGNTQTINENALSGAELSNIKVLVGKALKGKIVKSIVPATLGSQSGTISTYIGPQKKDLEGIIRIPTNPSKATKLTNASSAAIKSLKTIINRYVVIKMK